jgi:hypothetical protein
MTLSMTTTVTAERASEGKPCIGGMGWFGSYDDASWEPINCGKQADWTIRIEHDKPERPYGGSRVRRVNVRSYCLVHLPKAHRYSGLALAARKVEVVR